jgi:hypothetical protein
MLAEVMRIGEDIDDVAVGHRQTDRPWRCGFFQQRLAIAMSL